MNNLDILFVGGLFPDELKDDIFKTSKAIIQHAANTFQWAFVNGIEQNLKKEITIVTAPFVGYFPQYYGDLFFKSIRFTRGDNANCESVGFVNLPLVKKAFIYWNLKKSISKWSNPIAANQVMIVYSMNYSYLKAAVESKRKNPNLKICLIVTDLPDFPADFGNLFGWYTKKIEKPLVYRMLEPVDSFVFLTDKMSPLLNVYNRPWVRIEGLYDASLETTTSASKENLKTILYSGSIDNRYGIKELIGAFKLVRSPEYRLWICGGGVSQDFVEQAQIDDPRIKFLGNLSRSTVLDLQKKATVLINPRNTSGDYNEYSFPSKTMEYLASGTPAILYRLPGIPEEYFEHCFVVTDNSVESLAAVIESVCELAPSVLHEKGERARAFILKNKTPEIQTNKALQILNTL